MAVREELLDLLRTDARFREAARRELLTEELLSVPARLDRLTATVDRLAAAIERHDEQIAALIAAQRRTDERLEALTAAQQRTEEQIKALTTAVQGLEGEVRRLADWERGERGRREGERFERSTIRRGWALFCGGRPVSDRVEDLDRVRAALAPLLERPEGLPEQEDPFLADLLWLKGERMAVVEISRQVDGDDVRRAERCAAVLREGGIPAIGVVVGRDWASEEAENLAYQQQVEWRVAEGRSDGFEEFRRLSVTS